MIDRAANSGINPLQERVIVPVEKVNGSANLYFKDEDYPVLKTALHARSGGCEHPEGCPISSMDRLTIDHFTPRCIAAILGWTYEEANRLDNLQLLCVPHHMEKDETTESRLRQLMRQTGGGFVGRDFFDIMEEKYGITRPKAFFQTIPQPQLTRP